MQGKKELLSRVLERLELLALVARRRRDLLVVYGHHRIGTARGASSPFADDVFGQTQEEFEASIVWLKSHVRLISEDELIGHVRAGRRPSGLSVLLTFDDGYRDNYELALPVLERHRVPAVFFVPSHLIESRVLGWWDLIAWTLKRTRATSLEWEGRVFALPADRDAAIAHFHKSMQLLPFDRTRDLVARLAERCNVELPSSDVADRELMTWAQLKAAANAGIAIGSHTHTHRVLATIDEATQREELRESKALIEARLGTRVRSIAYPVGGYRHFTDATRRIAEETGYELGYSFCTGANRFGHIAPFDVRRIGSPLTRAMVAGTSVLPEIFDWGQPSAYGG